MSLLEFPAKLFILPAPVEGKIDGIKQSEMTLGGLIVRTEQSLSVHSTANVLKAYAHVPSLSPNP
jgi:hypothetical protein